MSYFIVVWKSNTEKCTTGGAIRRAAARSLRGAQHETRKARAAGNRRGGAALLSARGEWLYEPRERA